GPKDLITVRLRKRKSSVNVKAGSGIRGVINDLVSMIICRANACGARPIMSHSGERTLIPFLIKSYGRPRGVWPTNQGRQPGIATVIYHCKIGFKISICIIELRAVCQRPALRAGVVGGGRKIRQKAERESPG